jgi:pyridoxal phosphate enzyme (YggS family)
MTMGDPRYEFWQRQILEFQRTIPPSVTDSVRVVAVTKQMPADAVRAAYAVGIRDFGESKIQEAATKQAELLDLPDLTWHLIGHLQSNKAQTALQLFQWIHSVDSLKIAQRLDRLAIACSQPPQICLQVKLRTDPSKFGWDVSQLLAELPQLNELTHLQIRGLMTIPPLGQDPQETLTVFQEAKALARIIQQRAFKNIQMDQLSMGMSDDYLLALQAGATMIRPGRVLFGERLPVSL